MTSLSTEPLVSSDGQNPLVADDRQRRGTSVTRSVGTRMLRFGTATWLLVVFGVVWEMWTRASPSRFVPRMTVIVSTFAEEWLTTDPTAFFLSELFWDNGIPSLTRAAVGWLIAIVAGVGAGILLGIWKPAAWFFNPMVRFGLSTPSTILLPVAVLLFGITSSMNIFLITFGAVWVILINTTDGVQSLHSTTVLTARSLRLSRARYFFKILLPGASPQIFTGLRVSIGIALILMVVSELFAASEGIGFYIIAHQRTFRYEQMWSGILLIAIIGIVVNAAFALVENRVLRWHRDAFGGGAE